MDPIRPGIVTIRVKLAQHTRQRRRQIKKEKETRNSKTNPVCAAHIMSLAKEYQNTSARSILIHTIYYTAQN